MNREPINFNADDENYKALKYAKINTLRVMILTDSFSFPIGSTIAVQCEDGGHWTCGIGKEVKGTDHHGWSYMIGLMKSGKLIRCNMRHVQNTDNKRKYIMEQIKK